MFQQQYDPFFFVFQRFGGLEDLSAGMQGVLITTSDQEKLCVSEAYSLLNEVGIVTIQYNFMHRAYIIPDIHCHLLGGFPPSTCTVSCIND